MLRMLHMRTEGRSRIWFSTEKSTRSRKTLRLGPQLAVEAMPSPGLRAAGRGAGAAAAGAESCEE